MRRTILLVSLLSAAIGSVCASEQPKRRAPSGFTGVRGKKSIPDTSYSDTSQNFAEIGDEDILEKRTPSGFMGMRGKKPFPDLVDVPEEIIKRAPSGFMGMRGKKDSLESLMDDYDKRAPSGFMGMRGKKEYGDYGYEEKRAPSGFMGMRGKKDYDDMVEEIKRTQLNSFFGMRGKKPFGIRGKKYPYQFKGKFVGVRGKKMSNDIDDYGYLNGHIDADRQLTRLAENLDLNQLMLLLTENNETSNGNGNEYQEQIHV